MENVYVKALQEVMAQEKHFPKQIKDQWRTPEWLIAAIDKLYGPLMVDLFTDGQNSKCKVYFTAEDNALQQDWKATLESAKFDFEMEADFHGYDATDDLLTAKCFANPPYSPSKYLGKGKNKIPICGMTHIMRKAYEEHKAGCPSVWLVKSATSEDWWPNETASQIIHIKGRIGFERPHWFVDAEPDKPENGAAFGASIVIFNGKDDIQEKEQYITREELRTIGEPIAEMTAKMRAEWIESFDDL